MNKNTDNKIKNGSFLKGKHTTDQQVKGKKCSVSPLIRKIQIKIIEILLSCSWVGNDQKCWQTESNRASAHHQWKCKLIQTLTKTEWKFLKKLKIQLPYDLYFTIWHIYKGSEVFCSKDICVMFISALLKFPRIGKNL